MAKSRLEPKKIVRYADNDFNRQGLAGTPAPTIKSSPAAAKAAVAEAVAAPKPPAPTPTPPPPPPLDVETRAFVFDGATELTGSYPSAGGNQFNQLRYYTIGFTLAPGWGPEDTGSFVVWSVGNPNDDNDFRSSVFFERTSGSEGYQDFICSELKSGSAYIKESILLPNSPNFHNVSASNTGFTSYVWGGQLQSTFVNGTGIGHKEGERTTINPDPQARWQATYTELNSEDYTMSIGGFNSGSQGYLTGSMDNFYIAKDINYQLSHPLHKKFETARVVDVVYKFEGNISASKGGVDLEVVGTETYISSSL